MWREGSSTHGGEPHSTARRNFPVTQEPQGSLLNKWQHLNSSPSCPCRDLPWMPQAGSCQGRTHWSAAGVEVKLADSIDAPLGLSSPCSGVMVSLDPPGAPQGRRHAGRTRERRLGVVLICTRKPRESVFLFPGSGLGTLCPPPPPGYRRNPPPKYLLVSWWIYQSFHVSFPYLDATKLLSELHYGKVNKMELFPEAPGVRRTGFQTQLCHFWIKWLHEPFPYLGLISFFCNVKGLNLTSSLPSSSFTLVTQVSFMYSYLLQRETLKQVSEHWWYSKGKVTKRSAQMQAVRGHFL